MVGSASNVGDPDIFQLNALIIRMTDRMTREREKTGFLKKKDDVSTVINLDIILETAQIRLLEGRRIGLLNAIVAEKPGINQLIAPKQTTDLVSDVDSRATSQPIAQTQAIEAKEEM